MPSVSQKQHGAMAAACKGNSTLGIPHSVGCDYMHADKGNTGLPKRAPKKRLQKIGKGK